MARYDKRIDNVVSVDIASDELVRVYGTVAVTNLTLTGATVNIATVVNVGTVGKVSHIATGTLASITDVAKVTHIETGTLASITNVAQVAHIVTGTLANIERIGHIATGTIASVTNVAAVAHIVTGTIASITNVAAVAHIVTGTLANVERIGHIATGTIASVTNVASVTSLASGTVNLPTAYRDTIRSCIRTIDIIHAEIHKSNFWKGAEYNDNVDIAGGWNIVFRTGGRHANMFYNFAMTKSGSFELYENVSVATLGTAIPAYNADRGTTATTAFMIYTNPLTVTGTTVRLDVEAVGTDATTASGRLGMARNQDNEWILKPATNYLLRFTTLTDNTRVSCILKWYEEA